MYAWIHYTGWSVSEVSSDEASDDTVRDKIDDIEGISRGYSEEMHTILEMHVDLDLEGFEDMAANGGANRVKLPIVTIDVGSGEVPRIIEILRKNDTLKRKRQYFVHYKFLPGLGFYGFGLIHMIGGSPEELQQAYLDS